MNSDMTDLMNTFDSIINEHNEGLMFNDNDSMVSWVARCDWFIKQMVDLKVGAGFKFFELQKEYNPLQENSSVGEGEESE